MSDRIDYSGLQGLVDEGHEQSEKKTARKGWLGRSKK